MVDRSDGPPLVAADPDDDPYLWTAYVGAATHVVTWDAEVLALKHYREAQVVDPPSFLRELRRRGSFSAEGATVKGAFSSGEAGALEASIRQLRGKWR